MADVDVDARRAAITLVIAVLSAFAVLVQHHLDTYHEPTGVRKHPEDSQNGAKWLASCMRNDTQLFEETRLKREVWDTLLERLVRRGWLKSSRHCEAGEKLLCFLYLCANGSSYRNLSWRCGRSKDTISRLVPI